MNHDKSKEAFVEAQKFIAGGVNSPVRTFSAVGSEAPPFISHGEGTYIFDIDGNKYLDFVGSWGPLILGHADQTSLDELIKTAKKGFSFGAPTLLETQLAKEMLGIYSFLDLVRFCSSGTEATMTAIRLARGFTKKSDIIKFKGCYHGHSDGLLVSAGSAVATLSVPSCDGVLDDYAKHTLLCSYNDIQSVKDCFDASSDVAAIIIEPIAGNMGLVPADIGFLHEICELARTKGAVIIFDEVMSGFRASLNGVFGFDDFDVDLVTFGKVIGGGMSVGAVAGKAQIMRHLAPQGNVYQAGTLSGNPLAMATGLATLRAIQEDGFYEKLAKKAQKLSNGLSDLAKTYGVDLVSDYRGSMFGFFFLDTLPQNFDDVQKSDTRLFAKFHKAMLDLGVYLAPSAFETCFINAKMSDEDIEFALSCASEALKNL